MIRLSGHNRGPWSTACWSSRNRTTRSGSIWPITWRSAARRQPPKRAAHGPVSRRLRRRREGNAARGAGADGRAVAPAGKAVRVRAQKRPIRKVVARLPRPQRAIGPRTKSEARVAQRIGDVRPPHGGVDQFLSGAVRRGRVPLPQVIEFAAGNRHAKLHNPTELDRPRRFATASAQKRGCRLGMVALAGLLGRVLREGIWRREGRNSSTEPLRPNRPTSR